MKTNEWLDSQVRTSKNQAYRLLTEAQKTIGVLLAELTSDDPEAPGNDAEHVFEDTYSVHLDTEAALQAAQVWVSLARVPRA